MALRKLRISDFENHCDIIPAIYNGKSKFLIYGEKYNVTLATNGKVTVQKKYNQKLRYSNGGAQFDIEAFLIEEVEEKENLISLKDLSVEDREILLQEARNQIEQENARKNIINVFNSKRKQVTEEYLEEIYSIFNITSAVDKRKLKERYTSMLHLLYKIDNYGNQGINQKTFTITTGEEWESFQRIANDLKNIIINCSKEK